MSAELWLLHHKGEAFMPCQGGRHRLRLMTDDDCGGLRTDGGGAGEHVLDQRLPGNAMKDFGLRRFHPRALAGGENDDVGLH
jgi:hypothetical protein